MMKGWITKKIDDACEVEYGTRVVRKRDGGTIYPVYGGGGATFFMDTYNREDALVVARFAMSEECTRFVEGKFFLNDSGLTVTPKNVDELLPEFLNLQMLFLNDYIYSLSRGAAQRNLNVPAFRKTLINYPESIDEQQRIVSILDHCFEAIDKAKANAEQNLQNAKELFESYLQGVFEDNDFKKYLWSDVLEIKNGRSYKSVIDDNGIYPIIGSAAKVMGYANDYICNEGTTIIGRKGTINSPIYINEKFWNVDTAFGLEANSGLDKRYLYYFCLSFDFTTMDKGSGRPSLVKSDLLRIKMPIPSIASQQSIVDKLDTFQEKTQELQNHYQKKISDLEELKKSILQKAFAGELKTDKMVEEMEEVEL